MDYAAAPGILLDVLEYNMIFFNQQMVKYREKMLSGGSGTAFHYYDHFRTGKRKFEPPPQWLPLFRYRSSNYDFFPLFKFFWNTYDYTKDAAHFLQSLTGPDFKRCCFEHTMGKYSNEISVENVLKGDLTDTLRALALLAKDGEDIENYTFYLSHFEELAADIIPYLTALYRRMKQYHAQHAPGLLDKITEMFARSENELRLMHNISRDIPLSSQRYTICLMEHRAVMCRRHGGSDMIFFVGASGNDALKQWEETFGINLYSFGSALGSEVRYDIIQALRRGERTVSQLSKQLYISRSTVERCVLSLHKAHILSVAKRVGVETYFKLNPNYFIAAKAKLKLDIDDILEDISYGASNI